MIIHSFVHQPLLSFFDFSKHQIASVVGHLVLTPIIRLVIEAVVHCTATTLISATITRQLVHQAFADPAFASHHHPSKISHSVPFYQALCVFCSQASSHFAPFLFKLPLLPRVQDGFGCVEGEVYSLQYSER